MPNEIRTEAVWRTSRTVSAGRPSTLRTMPDDPEEVDEELDDDVEDDLDLDDATDEDDEAEP